MVTMLRYSVVLLAGLLAAGPAAAATWADQLFDEFSKDFGSVPRGPALVHQFRVANTTAKPINISSVRVSCGCVSAQALKTYLNPGEETVIQARMDTTRFTGVKTVTIYVQFNKPAFDEVRLLVQAIGRDDFSVTPDALAFGQVKKGATPIVETTITFYNSTLLQVGDVRCETNYIKPTLKEVSRTMNLTTYQLTAQLRADAPVGKWYSDVWIKTNNPTLPQIRIPTTVEIESALSVSPDVLAFGSVKLDAEMERRVIVRGIKPFKITSIDGKDEQVEIQESTNEEKKVHVLAVKCKGGKDGKAGELHRTVRLHTSLTEDGDIAFQVNATFIP
jgi:Protein of unknown function (DUF1573)